MTSLANVFPGGFDAAAVEPDAGRDFSPLPAGAYDASQHIGTTTAVSFSS